MSLPETVNLSAVEADLSVTGQFPELRQKIRQALVAQSCVADIREAKACFEALRETQASVRGWKSKRRETTEAALLSMSVILYVRATVTNAGKGERGPIQIDKTLSPEQLADHQALTDVRNEALAHVYTNREVAGLEWHTAAVLLISTEAGWTSGVANRRIRLEHKTMQRLGRQLPVALEKLSERATLRLDEVVSALEKHTSDDLNKLLGRCLLDPVALFGSIETARRALEGAKAGANVTFEGDGW